MARRHSSESSEDYVKDERGRYRHHSSHRRERTYERENGNRRRDTEDRHKARDRRSRYNSEEEVYRKSERDRGRDRRHRINKDDDDERNHRDKHVSKQQENSRMKEDGNGRLVEDSKPQRQSTTVEGNLNGDTSNLGKSGGVYIPPFKLARMMKEVQDKSSVEYQRLTWDALRKSINGLVNKVNAANIKNIIPELFSENLIRGRGLFCRSCMKSQMASPGFTDVFAALVAVVNTKFPEVGDLLLRRIVLQLKRAYKRNDKPQLLAAVKFIAHLVNQQVAHEIIALELLTVLLEKPTDDSVEVAVGFVTECGSILQDLSPKGLHGIFERFRGILHEGEIDKRVQFLIEGLFAIRKAKFQGYPAVRPELDLVEQEDQLTHEVSLDEEIDPEISLDIFKQDPNFLENEKRYEEVRKTILGEESEDEEGSEAGSDDEDDDEDEDADSDEEEEEQMKIRDETETNLINLRRTIYLTIMSSVDFEEAGHKLLKIKLEPGQEMELCIMLLECCSQERTYLRYYGLLGQRFCMINKVYQENFDKCFVQQYSMIHRLETNKLRNVAKFFAHLLGTDALPWHVLSYIRLTEEDTTSSSRIFIKILFQELSEHLGIRLLNERLNDATMQDSFESIFPRDNPKNTRFAINFFTSIGLGGLTENLREYLKNMPRLIMQQQKPVSDSESDDESGSSDASDSGTASSESESESSSSDESDNDKRRRKRRRR
ncbi:pre-mRNA-splicing factor CWC22-like protein [Senna tora]|uniref:Pre-mRNA-splicing factor CWC22-like protein n=1 Tax=Senna tora TaxID=362788 RepID=A0A834T533_9FABA|nr:pre-mRNA-splicing factor CWC22-like protein [Senna tora]